MVLKLKCVSLFSHYKLKDCITDAQLWGVDCYHGCLDLQHILTSEYL